MRNKKIYLLYCSILTLSMLVGCKSQTDERQGSSTITATESEQKNNISESKDADKETTSYETYTSSEKEDEESSDNTQTAQEEKNTIETSVDIQPTQGEAAAPVENETTTQEMPTYSYTEISNKMYAVSAVNVRNLPSVDGQRIGSLKAEQEISVTGQCNETGWYRINYNGQTGYVSNNYLTTENPAIKASDSTTPSNATETTTTEAANITDVSPTEPSGLVSAANLANRKNLQKKCSDKEFQAAYDAAVQIVTPLIGLSREEQLMGIASALRNMFDSGQVQYSTEAAHYDDPYGYFIAGVASCAGCTRATGLCLNMLNIPYEHVNENQWSHQWCRINIDGTYWICDAYGLYVGPEPEPYVHPFLQ